MSTPTTNLEILRCARCGTPVPLGDGNTVRCPSCGAEAPLPDVYRALRDAERAEAANRTLAASLYRSLGGRPPWWQRFCARVFKWWFLIYLYPALFLVVAFPCFWLIDRVGAAVHSDLWDTLGARSVEMLDFAIATLTATLGAGFGVYGRRTGISKARLQAALAARPPEREGGTACCRVCGAPLAVRPSDDGVRCAYCGADNLVSVDRAWLTAVAADAAVLGSSIEEAQQLAERDRRATRRALWKYGLGLAAAAYLFGRAFWGTTPTRPPGGWTPNDDGSWRALITVAQRAVIQRTEEQHGRWWYETYEPLPPGRGCTVLFTTPGTCNDAGCMLELFAALRERDALVIVTSGTHGARLTVGRHVANGVSASAFDPVIHDVALVDASPVTVPAAWNAWYRAELSLPHATAGAWVALCARIVPRDH